MSKPLITFFSVGGTTAKVAKNLARQAGIAIFEIKPAEPYTDADIKWTNPLARCNKEKIGKKEIAIAEKISGFEEYDTVFIGFPIWYYGAPNIIADFIKAYDWSGKRIALFATSGGSDIGKTAEKLLPFLNGKGEIVDSKLFRPSVTKEELKEWAEGIIKDGTDN
ncbi:MAG: flavodoxin [Ruminococcus sp.]|nr:flavodoxin [Ruminococcus sp.]